MNSNCCGCNKCNCSREIKVCHITRYSDIPMNIYYGEGYTDQDGLLAIADSIDQAAQCCCGSRSSCSGCACNRA